MNNPKYQAAILAATETRIIDFKKAMNWRTATKCEKLEILRDVAAMANVGGGLIIIGRDEPALTTGSMSSDEAESFDPTEFNKVVHRYLAPAHECRIETETVGGDTLVVVDVTEFETSPLIFQETGNCGTEGCKKSPHFNKGDVFIRTKAQQTQKVSSADEMRDVISRGILKTSDDLVRSIQRMLTSPPSQEEPLAAGPYDAEYQHEAEEFFDQVFYPWVPHAGHYDMTVRPVQYRKERLDRHTTQKNVLEYAFIVQRGGIFDSVPYEIEERTNFTGGSRAVVRKPIFHQYEAVSLYQSGLYRIVRSFPEDFEVSKDRTTVVFKEVDRTLWIDTFIETLTLFHLLARNIGRDLLSDPDEEMQVDLRIDGLMNRTLDANSYEMRQNMSNVHFRSHAGTENAFAFPLRTTLRSFEVDCVRLARERAAHILWTFGLAVDIGVGIQRRLLHNLEPIAFP